MKDFRSLSMEHREEWRRQDVTAMALAMLREEEAAAAEMVIGSVESGEDHDISSRKAGIRLGLKTAIRLLTEEK